MVNYGERAKRKSCRLRLGRYANGTSGVQIDFNLITFPKLCIECTVKSVGETKINKFTKLYLYTCDTDHQRVILQIKKSISKFSTTGTKKTESLFRFFMLSRFKYKKQYYNKFFFQFSVVERSFFFKSSLSLAIPMSFN